MKSIIFFGINFDLESNFTDNNDYNGYCSLSYNFILNLAEKYKIKLITDRSDLFIHPNIECTNIYKKSEINNLKKNWKLLFSIKDDKNNKFFSRDIILRFNALVDSIDVDKFNDFIKKNININNVILNRSEYSLLKNFFENKNISLILHDSGELRRLNYSQFNDKKDYFLNFEKILEQNYYEDIKNIICVSGNEVELLKNYYPKKNIYLLSIDIPYFENYKKIKIEKPIKSYFLGINNGVNNSTIINTLDYLEQVVIKNINIEFKFDLIGSICYSKIVQERINNIKNNNIKVELQGIVHNLSSVLPSYDLMIAIIKLGSGIPVKISEALKNNNYVITSSMGLKPYEDLKDKLVFEQNTNFSEIIKKINYNSKDEIIKSTKIYNKKKNDIIL